MSEHATDAMQQFGGSSSTDQSGPGLVLLYTNAFAQLPAGWPLKDQGPTTIGSGSDVDIHLPVSAVSRLHAHLYRDGGGYHIRDMASTNGTFVDGVREDEARLEHGQEVRIGDAIFKFVERDIAGYCGYRIDGKMIPGARRASRKPSNCIGGYQMDRLVAHLERVSKSPLSLLLIGESGTGKEVLAQTLHKYSGSRGDYVGINCGALTANLLESELFGYKRGAFSGADRDKPGLIRAAHNGTLLLDEIGDMPPEAQVRLLRVLQNREVLPVGATKPEPIVVRVIGATHRDLRKLQKSGDFRPDLYARLNEDQLTLPPLRDRKEDIFQLLQFFFERHAGRNLEVAFPFMMALLHYDWPYNVRQLESCAKRCAFLVTGDIVDETLLPEEIREAMIGYGSRPMPLIPSPRGTVLPSEDQLIDLLTRHSGNVSAIGREMGKARMQIHRWLKRYGLDLDDFRK